MKNKLFTLVATAALFLLYQCHGCKQTDCPNGYEEMDGVCGCPINGSPTETTYQAWYMGNDSIKFLEINQTIVLIGEPLRDTCIWYLHK